MILLGFWKEHKKQIIIGAILVVTNGISFITGCAIAC